MTIHHPSTIAKPPVFDAADFFEKVVQSALDDRREIAPMLGGGVLVFDLTGEGGGTWTIDLDHQRVERGAIGLADVLLELDAETFRHLVQQRIRVEDAVADDKLRIHGDMSFLSRLSILVRP